MMHIPRTTYNLNVLPKKYLRHLGLMIGLVQLPSITLSNLNKPLGMGSHGALIDANYVLSIKSYSDTREIVFDTEKFKVAQCHLIGENLILIKLDRPALHFRPCRRAYYNLENILNDSSLHISYISSNKPVKENVLAFSKKDLQKEGLFSLESDQYYFLDSNISLSKHSGSTIFSKNDKGKKQLIIGFLSPLTDTNGKGRIFSVTQDNINQIINSTIIADALNLEISFSDREDPVSDSEDLSRSMDLSEGAEQRPGSPTRKRSKSSPPRVETGPRLPVIQRTRPLGDSKRKRPSKRPPTGRHKRTSGYHTELNTTLATSPQIQETLSTTPHIIAQHRPTAGQNETNPTNLISSSSLQEESKAPQWKILVYTNNTDVDCTKKITELCELVNKATGDNSHLTAFVEYYRSGSVHNVFKFENGNRELIETENTTDLLNKKVLNETAKTPSSGDAGTNHPKRTILLIWDTKAECKKRAGSADYDISLGMDPKTNSSIKLNDIEKVFSGCKFDFKIVGPIEKKGPAKMLEVSEKVHKLIKDSLWSDSSLTIFREAPIIIGSPTKKVAPNQTPHEILIEVIGTMFNTLKQNSMANLEEVIKSFEAIKPTGYIFKTDNVDNA